MKPSEDGIQPSEAVQKPLKGWRACWGTLRCFASSSRKRDRHHPQLLPAANPSSNGNLQISESMPSLSSRSPCMHAPPSSPASFTYIDTLPSPAALLTLFPLNCVDDLCSNATPRADSSFRGLDPLLVTPPLHSTLTTEPTTPLSTAPFTPPPELAHLTTPPSPEVPFAELVASSFKVKCGDRVSEQTTTMEAYMDPSNVDIGFQVFSRNPLAISETGSTEFPSPLPERVPFLQGDTESASITSLLERACPFGFNQATSADAYGHCSPELIYEHMPQHDEDSQYVQSDKAFLNIQSDEHCRDEHLQTDGSTIDVDHSCESQIKEQQALHVLNNTNQRRRDEIPELSSASYAQVLEDSCYTTEPGPGFFSSGNMAEENTVLPSNDWKKGPEFNTKQPSVSAIRCHVARHMDGVQCAENCSTCGLLTSKCRELFEALHETKEKLSLIEEKENMLDDREKKCEQIFEWLKLEAKSQQASVTRLSKELSWQEEAFLDFQGKYLAELGVELPAAAWKDSSELPSEI